ncbi:MAG: MFS transporter [Burkholderiales bacterium]|nr:MFS transporter [Burkholderiales bacterium]
MTSSFPTSRPLPPRHRWKVLAAGVLANAAFSVAFSGIPMTAVLMRAGYRLDTATLGLVLGLMGLGIALSEVPWGLLTDRFGDRPVLLAGLASTGLALAAMAAWAAPSAAHVPALRWLAVGLVAVGLLGGSVNGASGRAVMRWFADGERGLAMSIRQTAVPLGGGVGALLLPVLALHVGFAAVYAFLAALCGVAALAAAWVRDPGLAEAAGAAASAGPSGPLRDPRIWRIVAGIGVLCAPQFALLSFGTVFLHDVGHAGLSATTATMVLVQAGAMGMRVWSGRWTDRRRNRPAFLLACARASALLFTLLAGVALLAELDILAGAALRVAMIAALLAGGVCVSAWHGVAYTELATRAGAGQAGTALGMANTAVFAICFLTPLAVAHLVAWHGWALAWLAAAACAWVAAPWLSSPASTRQPQPDAAAACRARR